MINGGGFGPRRTTCCEEPMTSELWDDLHGLDKVQAILAARQAREAKKRYNPNARMKGETPERHAQRLQFQVDLSKWL